MASHAALTHDSRMSKRHSRESHVMPTDWDNERTLEAAEAEALSDGAPASTTDDGRCLCGNRELLLQAYYAVTDGRIAADPLEVEGLTCPECGREFEAVMLEDGRVVRGELQGFADLDDPDDA